MHLNFSWLFPRLAQTSKVCPEAASETKATINGDRAPVLEIFIK